MPFRSLTIVFFLSLLAVIYNISFQTGFGKILTQILGQIPFADKVVHFLLMALFSFLLNGALNNRLLQLGRRRWLLGSFLVALFMTLEECTQLFIPARNFEIMDLVCNYAGIYTGGLLLVLLLPHHGHQSTANTDERTTTFSIQTIFHRTR